MTLEELGVAARTNLQQLWNSLASPDSAPEILGLMNCMMVRRLAHPKPVAQRSGRFQTNCRKVTEVGAPPILTTFPWEVRVPKVHCVCRIWGT